MPFTMGIRGRLQNDFYMAVGRGGMVAKERGVGGEDGATGGGSAISSMKLWREWLGCVFPGIPGTPA